MNKKVLVYILISLQIPHYLHQVSKYYGKQIFHLVHSCLLQKIVNKKKINVKIKVFIICYFLVFI